MFVIYLAIRSRATFCPEQSGLQFICRFQATAQAVQGIVAIGVIYCLGAVALGALWIWTQPSNPPCPVCGSRSRNDYSICKWCGHNFLPPPPRQP